MKYLVVMRGLYEPDNNTPSDKMWAKIAEFKDEHEMEQAENAYVNESVKDGAYDTGVCFFPLEDLQDGWVTVGEVWGGE